MRTTTATRERSKSGAGELLAKAALGAVLAFSGLIQLMKVMDAVSSGDHWLALHQSLIGLSSLVMATLVVVHRPAVAKGQGWASKAIAAIGSFAILPLGAMSLTWHPDWLLASTSAVLNLSYCWIVWALLTLRRSFSVFAEARKLVTHGPYGIMRHPLYAAYFLTYACSVPPRVSSLSLLVLAIGISAEITRAREEERVLSAAFPDYAVYARRLPAFLPAFNRSTGAGQLGRWRKVDAAAPR